jgi:hypothetical protein
MGSKKTWANLPKDERRNVFLDNALETDIFHWLEVMGDNGFSLMQKYCFRETVERVRRALRRKKYR